MQGALTAVLKKLTPGQQQRSAVQKELADVGRVVVNQLERRHAAIFLMPRQIGNTQHPRLLSRGVQMGWEER